MIEKNSGLRPYLREYLEGKENFLNEILRPNEVNENAGCTIIDRSVIRDYSEHANRERLEEEYFFYETFYGDFLGIYNHCNNNLENPSYWKELAVGLTGVASTVISLFTFNSESSNNNLFSLIASQALTVGALYKAVEKNERAAKMQACALAFIKTVDSADKMRDLARNIAFYLIFRFENLIHSLDREKGIERLSNLFLGALSLYILKKNDYETSSVEDLTSLLIGEVVPPLGSPLYRMSFFSSKQLKPKERKSKNERWPLDRCLLDSPIITHLGSIYIKPGVASPFKYPAQVYLENSGVLGKGYQTLFSVEEDFYSQLTSEQRFHPGFLALVRIHNAEHEKLYRLRKAFRDSKKKEGINKTIDLFNDYAEGLVKFTKNVENYHIQFSKGNISYLQYFCYLNLLIKDFEGLREMLSNLSHPNSSIKNFNQDEWSLCETYAESAQIKFNAAKGGQLYCQFDNAEPYNKEEVERQWKDVSDISKEELSMLEVLKNEGNSDRTLERKKIPPSLSSWISTLINLFNPIQLNQNIDQFLEYLGLENKFIKNGIKLLFGAAAIAGNTYLAVFYSSGSVITGVAYFVGGVLATTVTSTLISNGSEILRQYLKMKNERNAQVIKNSDKMLQADKKIVETKKRKTRNLYDQTSEVLEELKPCSPGQPKVNTKKLYTDEEINTILNYTFTQPDSEYFFGYFQVGESQFDTFVLKGPKEGKFKFGRRDYAWVAVLPAIDNQGVNHRKRFGETDICSQSIRYFFDKKCRPISSLAEFLSKLLPQLKEIKTKEAIIQRVNKLSVELNQTYERVDSVIQQNADLTLIKKMLKEVLKEETNSPDVLDEILPKLLQEERSIARIIFPLNDSSLGHWETCEIVIKKMDESYFEVDIYQHDPFGKGTLSDDLFGELCSILSDQISNYVENLQEGDIHFRSVNSGFNRRQNDQDSTSCGVIICRDIPMLIQDQTLNLDEPYKVGAVALRLDQVETFKRAGRSDLAERHLNCSVPDSENRLIVKKNFFEENNHEEKSGQNFLTLKAKCRNIIGKYLDELDERNPFLHNSELSKVKKNHARTLEVTFDDAETFEDINAALLKIDQAETETRKKYSKSKGSFTTMIKALKQELSRYDRNCLETHHEPKEAEIQYNYKHG